jgi:hypothetical protein
LLNIVLATTLVIVTASSAAAQGAPQAAPADGGPRPLWKNVLIGVGAGVGGGLMLGKALSYAQEAKCDGGAPNVECTTPYNEKTLSITFGAIGVAVPLILHMARKPSPSKVPSVIFSRSSGSKAILLRTEF